MVITSEIREFFRENRKKIVLCIFLFWLIFAILIIIEDELGVRIANMKHDPVDRLQYCIRWILWTVLTPLIIFLALRFPIRKNFVAFDIAKHCILALLVIGLEFIIEIPIIRYATLQINGKVEPVTAYAAIFIFKLNIYLLLYFVVIGTTYLVLYIDSHNRSKMIAQRAELKSQQLQSQLSAAKLSFLKMQLDPHFLFNTHHSIISLMINGENAKATKMLTMLSDLLRMSLDNQQQLITLESELKLVKLYLDIQQIRFEDRMKFSFNIDPKTVQQKVPSFILQPLVENAIKHGISASSATGVIDISSTIENNTLILKVKNDSSNVSLAEMREGIGISNSKERLKQLYNGRSAFELTGNNDGVITASLIIPIN